MVIFGIKFEQRSGVVDYLAEFKRRTGLNAFLDAKLFIHDDMAIFYIQPLIFKLYYLAPIIWILGFIFSGGFNMSYILIGLIPGITYIFYMKYIYLLALYIGIYKGKYKGKIKPL